MHIHAILLAAGESKRFGGIKQLAQTAVKESADFKPLITVSSEALLSSHFNSYKVMLGANASAIKPYVAIELESEIFANWQLGMGATIARAMLSVPCNATHVCIALADQLKLTNKHFNQLIIAAKEKPNKIIAAHFNRRLGAPCIFPRQYFKDLAGFSGDKGARDLLRKEANAIYKLDMEDAKVDIDTKDDLAIINATVGSN